MIVGGLGFSGAGKTCYLRAHLYPPLQASGASFYVLPANPDGEGQWIMREKDRQNTRDARRFTERFVDWVIDSAPTLAEQFEVVYLDCGGLISRENERILSICDEAIIVSRNSEEFAEWEQFVSTCKAMAITQIRSSASLDGELTFRKIGG